MDETKLSFTPENVAQDVLAMSGKPGPERQQMANKASHKLSVAFNDCTKEEFREYFNDLALKSRIDADKSQKVFCKTTDNKIHDSLKPDDKDIKEIWIGDPMRDIFLQWDNYKVFSQDKEMEKKKSNQASLSQRAGMLRTLMDENKIE